MADKLVAVVYFLTYYSCLFTRKSKVENNLKIHKASWYLDV